MGPCLLTCKMRNLDQLAWVLAEIQSTGKILKSISLRRIIEVRLVDSGKHWYFVWVSFNCLLPVADHLLEELQKVSLLLLNLAPWPPLPPCVLMPARYPIRPFPTDELSFTALVPDQVPDLRPHQCSFCPRLTLTPVSVYCFLCFGLRLLFVLPSLVLSFPSRSWLGPTRGLISSQSTSDRIWGPRLIPHDSTPVTGQKKNEKQGNQKLLKIILFAGQ